MSSTDDSDPAENTDWETRVVLENEDRERLDSFLVRHFPKYSRGKLQRSIAAQDVTLDDVVAKSSTRVRTNQVVRFRRPKPTPEGSVPENIPLEILHEDEHLVVINKPPAMVVHPAKGHWSGTLTAGLAFHFQSLSQVGGPTRPGIVHRLDRDTSGVILVAKTDEAHHHLAGQFEARTVEKEYLAIVSPAPDRDNDLIDKPIGAHPYQREKKAIRENHPTSKQASSIYEVLERFHGFGLVRVKPKTGRTHQIRVHMASVGCAVLCDRLYSGRASVYLRDLTRRDSDDKCLLERQALHAHRIKVRHPSTHEPLQFEAPIPADFQKTLDALREHRAASTG